MTPLDHETLSDRMPEVAAGRATWTVAEQGHLDGCAECREEWALVRAAAALGAQVEREFDSAGAARVVAARWPEAPGVPVTPLRRIAYAALAAAAVITMVFFKFAIVADTFEGTPEPVHYLSELDSLTTEELVLVADRLDLPLTELEGPADASLSDLDTTQLGRILRSLEG